MNREKIIEMARGAGIIHPERVFTNLECFFHMAQAAEREACAKVADEMTMPDWVNEQIAKAIRARGQQ